MRGPVCWGFLSCPVPTAGKSKENHTEISISYNADWPISSSLLLANSHILINPFFWSMLAMWLSTFFSGAAHILLLQWSGQEWEESTSSFPEFSCSPCIISTSYLVFPPTPPAWPISVYLKHDWQNTDNSPAPSSGLHIFLYMSTPVHTNGYPPTNVYTIIIDHLMIKCSDLWHTKL